VCLAECVHVCLVECVHVCLAEFAEKKWGAFVNTSMVFKEPAVFDCKVGSI
jgi:hypothetical protein